VQAFAARIHGHDGEEIVTLRCHLASGMPNSTSGSRPAPYRSNAGKIGRISESLPMHTPSAAGAHPRPYATEGSREINDSILTTANPSLTVDLAGIFSGIDG
jgi:hypothetical protein